MNKVEKAKFDKDPEAYVASLVEAHADELKAKDEAHAAALEAKDEAHAAELEAAKESTKGLQKVVPGTFTAKNKKEYRFKKGCVKTRNNDGVIVDSELMLKDKAFMQNLVDIEAGIIEEV